MTILQGRELGKFVRAQFNSGLSRQEISEKYNIPYSNVYAILKNLDNGTPKVKTKTHIKLPQELDGFPIKKWIKIQYDAGFSVKVIADNFSVSKSYIYKILNSTR